MGGPGKSGRVSETASAHLVLIPQSAGTVVGVPLAPAIIAKVEDQFGNVVIAGTSSVTMSIVSAPSGGTLGGTTTVKVSKGVATFSKATLSVAGDYTLALTDATLAITTPVQFVQTVTPGITTIIAPHPAPSYKVGQTINLAATFKSSASTSVPFTGTATILGPTAQVLGTATVAANGSVKFALTGLVAGTYLCTLAYPGDVNHTPITSTSFTLLVKP